jgi:arylsulfatase
MDVHAPYDPVSEYRDQYTSSPPSSDGAKALFQRAMSDPESITPSERQTLIDLYDAEIRYVDDMIGSLLNSLKRRGRLRDSVVFLTADHGDGFGEHGYYNHPRRLHDELVHVPLIVTGIDQADIVETPVSTLDIVPTITAATPTPDHQGPGEPLQDIAADEDRVVFSQARGEGDESNLRRFRATDRTSQAFVQQDLVSSKLGEISVDGPNKELKMSVREYANSRYRFFDDIPKPPTSESVDEVEDRLEALGYK